MRNSLSKLMCNLWKYKKKKINKTAELFFRTRSNVRIYQVVHIAKNKQKTKLKTKPNKTITTHSALIRRKVEGTVRTINRFRTNFISKTY